MIVPMKKVSLVILEREKEVALKTLRKLGVVHLENIEGASEKLSSYRENLSNAIQVLSIFSEIKSKVALSKEVFSDESSLAKCKEIISLVEEKKVLSEKISSDTVELERFSKWGSVDPKDFSYLSENGIDITMYEIPVEKYNALDDSIDTILVSAGKKEARFLLLQKERPETFPPEAFEVPLPRCSTSELVSQIETDSKRITEIDNLIIQNAVYAPQIKKYREKLEKEIEFENVFSGMGSEEDTKDTSLAWISGFVPIDSFDLLKTQSKENCWALVASDIADEDDPPTKLKNNKLVSLIYPLTDFLGTVPSYREFDISGWFLLFFVIFFGMIFGDGGYGLLLLVTTLFLMLRAKTNGKKINPAFGLLVLLSISTVVWGTFTCTWFGLSVDQIPMWLKDLSIEPISAAYVDKYDGINSLLTTNQNLQVFCFSLALIQLTIAHIKCFINDIKSPRCLGDFGSMILLWGMFYIVLMLVISGDIFSLDKVVNGIPVGTIAICFIGAGFLLSFIFSSYDGSIARSVLESCKNIISVVLGVVNVFSDIVSYIRLWAVAIAGGAISNTVNTMAGPLLGHALFFVLAIILLVFGHGLNIVLNVLSVIVHGVRLNTLEFSSHLGMTWSGYKYEPFRETVQN